MWQISPRIVEFVEKVENGNRGIFPILSFRRSFPDEVRLSSSSRLQTSECVQSGVAGIYWQRFRSAAAILAIKQVSTSVINSRRSIEAKMTTKANYSPISSGCIRDGQGNALSLRKTYLSLVSF